MLIEKAICSSDYKLYLMLIHISKAFDTVDRNKLFEQLENILSEDELHILSILTNEPKITVKVGNTLGDQFITSIGIMQGDCLSAVLFIFYLACCINEVEIRHENFIIKPKYADDTTYIATDKKEIEVIENMIPKCLSN